MRPRHRLAAPALAILALTAGALALAVGARAAETSAEAPAIPAAGTILGFRSASFGMDEAAVRSAIEADFAIGGDAVRADGNIVQQTRALTIDVPSLIEGTGPATVAYIFGYQSKALIQVNALWPATGGTATSEDLVRIASTLQAFFLGHAYAAGTMITNQPLPDGTVLAFAGRDEQGHQVTLTVIPAEPPVDAGSPATLTLQAVRLSYIAAPDAPDIFALPPGAF
jgi:hypothetical protein